jgi:hypothetical protein
VDNNFMLDLGFFYAFLKDEFIVEKVGFIL